MKLCRFQMLAIFFAHVFLASCAWAQGALCEKMLEGGLYQNFRMVDTGDFNQDFKTYLFSAQFKQDLKDKKWGTSITVPIEGVPVSLGANSSDAEVSQFRQQIQKQARFSVSSDYRKTLVSSIPNVDLAKVYSECVGRASVRPGFRVEKTFGDTWANFVVAYTKQVAADPMPVVTSFQVRNGTNVSTTLAIGSPITDITNVTSDRDATRDLLLFIQTDRGVVSESIPADPQLVVGAGVPIGTVVSSMLSPDQFYVVTASNEKSPGGVWTSQRSKWTPADGRIVPGSQYERISSKTNVPDLRGMFIRGVNIMDSVPQVALDPDKQDPDSRSAGSYQADALKRHKHQYNEFRWQVNVGNGPFPDGVTANPGNRPLLDTTQEGGPETRPKNVAVYYYIRIN